MMTLHALDTPDSVTLGQQIAALPAYVLKAWCTCYATTDGPDVEARTTLNQEAAAVRAGGVQPDALTLWMPLADKVMRAPSGAGRRQTGPWWWCGRTHRRTGLRVPAVSSLFK